MAWIRTIAEDEATGEVKEVYEALRGFMGRVPNITKAFSLRPQVLKGWMGFAQAAYVGVESLTPVQRELIATVVSALNNCHY